MAPHFHADLNGGAFEHSHADATVGPRVTLM